MYKKFFLVITLSVSMLISRSQEIQARLVVSAGKIGSQVDKKIFQTLQSSLINFVNNRRWTNDVFKPVEKIQCNFLLSVEQDLGNNVYKGKLTIQAARPVFNSSYDSPIINYLDDNITFRYVEFQPIEFNENRVQGNDPLAANLPAVFAYYINLILGFDYNAFALRGGEAYIQKAWNIVNNAPESREITGWKSFESQRNRYWLAENLNNNRFTLMNDVLYSYYRSGLDLFSENEQAGRIGIMNSINYLNTINADNPNSMILQFFFQGKSNELVKIFSKANDEMKARAKSILEKLDLTNASAYKQL